MNYNPESEPTVADEDEDMDQQALSSSPGQSQIEVLMRIAEPVTRQLCNVCRRTGATCTPLAGNLMVCLNRRLNAMAVVLGKVYIFMICQPRLQANINAKIRECANSVDYGPSPSPSHDSTSSPLEATNTPPRYSPEPRKMPTAALWDLKTGKQIETPPRYSPEPRRMPIAALWDPKTGKQIETPPRYSPEPRRMPTAALWDPKTGKQIETPPRYSPEPLKMPTAALWDPKTGKQIDSPPRKTPVGREKGANPSQNPTATLWMTKTGEQIYSPLRYSQKPLKMPTAALWDPKTGKQIDSPPRKSPVGKQKGLNSPKTPRASTTRDPPAPTLGTFWPSGNPTIQALYPGNDPKVESVVDSQETNRKSSDDSQEREIIEGFIKNIQQPLEGSELGTLEPDSKVSRDQAMVGSAHAAQKMALWNSPGKLKGQSTDQPAEPERARRTTEELDAARNIGG